MIRAVAIFLACASLAAAHTVQTPMVCVQEDAADVACVPILNCDANVTCDYDPVNNRIDIDTTGGPGGGTSVALDLADNGNDSAALTEIATTGDPNGVFTEPSADKLLIDATKDWPKCDTSDDLTCTDCIGATEILESGLLLQNLGGEATVPQLPDSFDACSDCSSSFAATSFVTMDTPSGTDPVADLTADTLQFAAGGIVSITGNAAADSITIAATEVDGSTSNELQSLFETVSTPAGTSPVADTTTDTLTLLAGGIVTITGNSGADSVTIAATEVDGSTSNEIQNLFQTVDTPSGTDPVADTSTDTLGFIAGGIVTITGDSSNDTVTVSATEVDGSTTNELQNIFQTIDTSSGTDPVADTTTDTVVMAGTAPITVTGNAGADSVTVACDVASGSQPGCLSSANWTTFNDKISSFTFAGDGGTPQSITNGNTATVATGAGLTSTAAATDTVTINLDQVRVDQTAGVDCTGASDSTTGVQNALNALAPGRVLLVPSGCRLGLASPGAGNASISVPSGAHIRCEDSSAGFAALRQRCTGGTYPNAACSTDAECLGGGTCDNDFGAASANPCTGSTCYAPTGGSTYTMLKDTATSAAITIENCSFFTTQADPYQRCVGGTNAGAPTRQECDAASTVPGIRCNSNAECGAGTCLRLNDCMGTAGGSASNGAPLSAVGAGKINPLDLARTIGVVLRNVKFRDHFNGDFSVKVYSGALEDVDTAAEATDCTSPLASTPATSACFNSIAAGQCCYGAANFLSLNTQPTTAVTDGIAAVAERTEVHRSKARGSTNAINLANTRSTIAFAQALPVGLNGPGTAGGGFTVGANGNVVDSFLLFLKSGSTGIVAPAGTLVRGNHVGGSYTTGISLTGAGADASKNVLSGTGTTGIAIGAAATASDNTVPCGSTAGIAADGNADKAKITLNTITGCAGTANGIQVGAADSCTIEGNYVDGNSSGAGILSAGLRGTIVNNQIHSVAVDTLDYGIVLDDGASGTNVEVNTITRPQVASIRIKGIDGGNITGNTSVLSNAHPTSSLKPVHLLDDTVATAIIYDANLNYFGWRGVVGDARTDGLANIQITSGRFVGLAGAPVGIGGAGVLVLNNYINQGAAFNAGPTLTCDASCSNRGALCVQDSDCTSCDAAVQKCIPEPLSGFVGSPTVVMGSEHNVWVGNTMFDGRAGATKQCTVAGNIGQQCTVAAANGTCAGGATCSGGPPARCQSGADGPPAGPGGLGKLCCQTGAGATCAVRSDTPYLRILDFDTAISHNQLAVARNDIFNSSLAPIGNAVGIDAASAATPGGVMTLRKSSFIANTINMEGAANTIGIRFPASPAAASDNNWNGNNFIGLAQDVVNWKGTYGDGSFVPKAIAMAADQTTNSTSFVNLTALAVTVDVNRTYNFRCDFIYTAAATTTGIGFDMTGPTSPTSLAYMTYLPCGNNTAPCSAAANGIHTSNLMFEVSDGSPPSTESVTTGTFSTSIPSVAKIEGILTTGANAGTLQARVKAEVATNVTVKAGSSCLVFQTPQGS